MTRPAPHPLLAESRPDTSILARAVAAAVLLHLAALWIPMPDAGLEAPPEKEYDGPIIVHQPLPPPTITPPAAPPPAVARRSWIPGTEVHEFEPVAEPAVFVPEATGVETIEVVGDVSAPPAPAVPDIYLDGTPGVTSPVAFPDQAEPDYPEVARVARKEGRVILRAVIDEEGVVTEIEVLQAPIPDFGFERAAVDAVRQWRYEPARVGDRAVRVRITVSLEFTLN